VARIGDAATPHRIPRLLQVESEIARHGGMAVVDEVRSRRPDPQHWPLLFESAWLSSCLDHSRIEDPSVAGFNGRTHEETVGEFCALDRERLKLAAARVRRAHAENVI